MINQIQNYGNCLTDENTSTENDEVTDSDDNIKNNAIKAEI